MSPQTCKMVEALTRHRDVWLSVWKRLHINHTTPPCGAVAPEGHLIESIVLRALSIDKNWTRGTPNLSPTRIAHPSLLIFKTTLLPGGRWLLSLAAGGRLHFWDLDQPVLVPVLAFDLNEHEGFFTAKVITAVCEGSVLIAIVPGYRG